MSKSLIIDPGHGGIDPGANAFGVAEKNWNLVVSLYQYERLKELGVNVGITRKTDISLHNDSRVGMIKDKFDYCMSNHFNAFNGKAGGIETIHSIYTSDKIAKILCNVIGVVSGLPVRDAFSREGINGDYYYMHRRTGKTETIIVEYGFLDNKQDHDYYKNPVNMFKVAEVIVEAWCSILGVTYKPKKANIVAKLYKVQVGAFESKDNANNLSKQLQKDGYKTYIVHE